MPCGGPITATTSPRRATSTISPRMARSRSSLNRRLASATPMRTPTTSCTSKCTGTRPEFCYFFFSADESVDSAATKASCGTSTRPMVFIRFLPSFCFSSSLRLRVMSPP